MSTACVYVDSMRLYRKHKQYRRATVSLAHETAVNTIETSSASGRPHRPSSAGDSCLSQLSRHADISNHLAGIDSACTLVCMHVVHLLTAPGRIHSCYSCMTAATSTVNKICKYLANAWSYGDKNEMVQFRKGRRSLTLITVSWSQGTYVNHSILLPGYLR